MIHRDIEKTLDLPSVEIHGEDPVGPGDGDKIGHQFGADGHPRRNFVVLPGISIIGQHGGDAVGRCPFQGVDHDQQFHQIGIDGRGRGLNDEYILARARSA